MGLSIRSSRLENGAVGCFRFVEDRGWEPSFWIEARTNSPCTRGVRLAINNWTFLEEISTEARETITETNILSQCCHRIFDESRFRWKMICCTEPAENDRSDKTTATRNYKLSSNTHRHRGPNAEKPRQTSSNFSSSRQPLHPSISHGRSAWSACGGSVWHFSLWPDAVGRLVFSRTACSRVLVKLPKAKRGPRQPVSHLLQQQKKKKRRISIPTKGCAAV